MTDGETVSKPGGNPARSGPEADPLAAVVAELLLPDRDPLLEAIDHRAARGERRLLLAVLFDQGGVGQTFGFSWRGDELSLGWSEWWFER